MSGPKTSQYTLTPEQRRILEEQRKIRQERELFAKQQGDIRSVLAEADQILKQLELLQAEMQEETDTVSEAKKLRDTVAGTLSQASGASDSVGSEQLREWNRSLQENARKLASRSKALKAELAAADRTFRSQTADRIDSGFLISFDTVGNAPKAPQTAYTGKITAELEKLDSLFLTPEQITRAAAIRAKFADIDDPVFLKNFYAMTVCPFVRECAAYSAAYETFGAEYERKRYIYEANARTLGIDPEVIPFSSDAIALLDAKIAETEDAIAQQEEQAYISRCVDEAMREMGYLVVGSREVVRRSGKRFRNQLYLFEEGTAVNVTYSSDGQITMELGGIGTDDRLPSEAESTSLAADMRSFCDDYREIERRLLSKGVATSRISVLPPDAQYASIINVSDYTLSAEVSEYEAKGTKKSAATSKSRKIGE